MNLRIHASDGRVSISVPFRMGHEEITKFLISHIDWIRRKQKAATVHITTARPKFVTGEIHFFLGHAYRLRLIEDHKPENVLLTKDDIMELHVHPDTDRAERGAILELWYRRQLETILPKIAYTWERKIGVSIAELRIRKMKTRWGSCNIPARRIWINLELIKRPVHCIEFILIHEMLHMIERRHDNRFYSLMDRFMPQWREHAKELDQAHL